jgi:hypothetical protein
VIQQSGQKPTISRFPAQELEKIVTSQIHLLLASPARFANAPGHEPDEKSVEERSLDLAKRWREMEISKQQEFARSVMKRVIVGDTKARIVVDRMKLAETLLGKKCEPDAARDTHEHNTMDLTAPFTPVRRGGEVRFAIPDGPNFEGTPVPSLVKAIARAHIWYDLVVLGEVGTIGQLAQKTGIPSTYVKRILRSAMLSPRVTEAILSGKHRPNLTLQELVRNIPMDWREQNDRLAPECHPPGEEWFKFKSTNSAVTYLAASARMGRRIRP